MKRVDDFRLKHAGDERIRLVLECRRQETAAQIRGDGVGDADGVESQRRRFAAEGALKQSENNRPIPMLGGVVCRSTL